MKCPLMTLEYRLIDQGGSIYVQDCLKEECAWWIKCETEEGEKVGRCAVVYLATRIFQVEQVP